MADLPITSDEGGTPVVVTGTVSPFSTLAVATNGSLQTLADNTGTGTITALNGTVVAITHGCSSVAFNVTGTWVATLTVQATSDGTNWSIVNCNILATDITTQTFANNEFLVVPCGGFQQVRLIATAFTSGTIAVAWNAGAGTSPVITSISPVAASFQTEDNGAVTTIAPTYTTGTVQPLSLTTTGSLRVNTNDSGLAQGSTTAGELGELVMGAVTTANPAYTTGQTDPLSLTTFGGLRISAADQTGTGSLTAAAQTVVANTNGCSSVIFAVIGTFSGSYVFDATLDNINWIQIFAGEPNAADFTQLPCGGYLAVRIRAFSWTSGTASITWYSSLGANLVEVWQPESAYLNATVVQGTAANFQAEISGAVTTDPPVYATATVQPLSLSTAGSLRTEQFLTSANVYGVGTGAFTPPATPTDVATIIGSATRTVYVTRLEISTTQTTAGVNTWFIIKRSAADTGGTSATPTPVPLDSNNPAVTAVVRSYTANPTALGAAVGTIRTTRVLSDAATTAFQSTYTFDFTNGGLCSGVVLRGVAQTLALSFNGAVLPAGLSVTTNFEWIEV